MLREIGAGPAVVFLHGFPEIWYSWWHQMTAVAKAGFRTNAPDFRGYGLSEVPAEPEKRQLLRTSWTIFSQFLILLSSRRNQGWLKRILPV